MRSRRRLPGQLVFSPAKFRSWLLSNPPGGEVGTTTSQSRCPAARYFEAQGGRIPFVWTHEFDPGDGYGVRLSPPRLKAFIGEVDLLGVTPDGYIARRSVTAAQALAALDRIAPPSLP